MLNRPTSAIAIPKIRGTRRRIAKLGGLVASLAMLTSIPVAASTGTAQAADSGGTLKIAMSAGNVPIPDPACDQGAEGLRFVCDNVYDQLYAFNLDQSTTLPTPHPDLATHYTLSPDHLTWTFYLRKGVAFTDGTPFNADAVIFNWERITDPKFKYYSAVDAGRMASYTAAWKSFKKVNQYEVQITTKEPYAYELWDQTWIFYASPAAVKKWGNANYPEHAVGTGPFMIKKYVNNVTMELVPNKHYWKGAPKLNEIDLFPQPEDASRLASLESGSVNWAEVPSPDAVSELKGQGYKIFLQDAHPGAIMPFFNEVRGPLKNPLVRKALEYAVNRRATAAVIDDTGIPASQFVPKGNPYFIPNYTGYTYNPKKAKALLAEAGYGPGKRQLNLKMIYPPNGSGNMYPEPMMEQLQSSFKAVGVNLSITPLEWDTFGTISTTGGARNPQYAKYNIFWASPAAGAYPIRFEMFLCSNNGIPQYTGYCDPKVDKIWKQAEATWNFQKQTKIIQSLEKRVESDAPILYWVTDKNLRVMASDIHGYVNAQSWYVDFTKIWVS